MARYHVTLSKAARIYGKRREAGETVEVDAVIYGQLRYHNAIAHEEKAPQFVEGDFTETPTPSEPEQDVPTKASSDYTREEIIKLNAKEQRAFIEQHNLQVNGYKRLTAPELERELLVVLGFESGE